jgi:LacI family transcriptional regulator
MEAVLKTRTSPKLEKVRGLLQSRIDSGNLKGMLPGVHQLAREFGLNFQTVNKAVNDLVKENVLSRIPSTGTFVKQKNRFGLLIPNILNTVLEIPVYANVIHGVERQLSEYDKTMTLWHSMPSSDQFANDVDGIILFTGPGSGKINPGLIGVPCVRIMGLIDSSEPWDHVTYDNRVIGELAAEHLISGGHINSVYVGPAEPNEIFRQRTEVFKKKILGAGGVFQCITDEHLRLIASDFSKVDRTKMVNLAKVVAALMPKPTGLFVPADMFACAIYGALEEAGLRPGKDIHVVSCNNEKSFLMGLHPRPAVIDIHAEEIGRKAVDRLLWRIRHKAEPCEKILVKPVLL